MDHYSRIQLAIDHLEAHLQEPFDIKEAAAAASFSAFHFQRLFQAITGFTVLEYVRRRRLTESASALRNTAMGVLEIALNYGYQSQEAFTRAFDAHFGTTPARFRKAEEPAAETQMQCSINFNEFRSQLDTAFHMNSPRLVTLKPIRIVGYEYQTHLSGAQHYGEIPGFYHEFGREQRFMSIPDRLRPDMAYGIATHFQEDGAFSFIVGEESSGRSDSLESLQLEPGYTSLEIPGGLYAEFTTEGSEQDVRKMIYGSWLPASKYEHREGPDFEVTDVWKSTPERLDMKIYIPLQ
ncbi:effector binding domain-containing protein [Paenibacillus barcinonensis]|uniref:AraC family transcriptional regulator n=1 Tax=Paenibacillus barcinonensis TaxID=198119 RepID=A0A2V4VAX5_PAEBA|nr:effector binding domain-containing protein [Paenibacillus barcinonensis]PYE50162.1 AraC family transcriptional regulator [Paenibacillus barcinonensis]QKS54865.1 effector binding domain-containing protein [Paenibacillus barcinonensis]